MLSGDTKNRNVGLFFALTFAYAWILWLPSVLVGFGVITLPFDVEAYSLVAVLIGAFAPLFAAVTLIVRQKGWSGARELIRRGFDFHVKPIYILASLLLPLAIAAGAHYFTIFTTSFSVQLGWLYNASGKKLLVPWLFHAMGNTVAPLFPAFHFAPGLKQPGYWVFAGANALASLIIGVWFIKPYEMSGSKQGETHPTS